MRTRAFTLIEVLIVVAIITVLSALLLGALRTARDAAHVANCASNLRQIGGGIASYASDHNGDIPYGPTSGGGMSAGDFYPATGNPTSLISLQDGRPVALGLLLDHYLARTPQVLFCPGTDQALNAAKELAKVGQGQAQSGYYYRHGGNTAMYDNYGIAPEAPPLKLGALGDNRKGQPIRALVMDTVFLCPPLLKSFGVNPVSNHRGRTANVLYTDGHVKSHENDNGRYSVDVRDISQLRSSFDKIVGALEVADAEP